MNGAILAQAFQIVGWGKKMARISEHTIDPQRSGGRKPLNRKINFYVDGFGAYKTCQQLYEIGDSRLEEHLRSESKDDMAKWRKLYDHLYAPPAPSVFAEILSFSLALIELHVVSKVEEKIRLGGTALYPNALLVNQSNPINVEVGNTEGNLLEALYPLDEEDFLAEHYLNPTCDGIIYSTGKIDRNSEARRLEGLLRNCPAHDGQQRAWLEKNLDSIHDGKFFYRNRDGSIGSPLNFDFTEEFYDAVADGIGYYSRLGRTKVHWNTGLSDYGEKGVDCDLIMQVMDDLHSGGVDVFVFMTNDMDFFPLIQRIQDDGKDVFLCGLKSSFVV